MRTLLLSLTLFLSVSAYSQPGLKWKTKYNGPSFVGDRAAVVTYDHAGNIIMSGYETNSCTGEDWKTVKYNSNGQKLWGVSYTGFNRNNDDEDRPIAIDCDMQNNIYVTGYADSINNNYIATVKYSPAGVQLWSVIYKSNISMPASIDVDDQGNVYVAGKRSSANNNDMFLVKYNTLGVQQWIATYGANLQDEATDVKVDNNGNVYLTGFGGFTTGNGYDWATIKYTGAGVQVWANTYSSILGNHADRAAALAIDTNGDVIVTGQTKYYNVNSYDIITIKYTATGAQAWTCPYSRSNNNDDTALDITTDLQGNSYVLGNSPGPGTYNDHEVIKINASGIIEWVAVTDTLQKNNYGWAITIDSAGQNIYVASDINIGPDQYSDRDFMIQQYNLQGAEVARKTFNGDGNGFDIPFGMAVSGTGEIALAGVMSRSLYDTDLGVVVFDNQLDTIFSAYQNGQSFVDDIGRDLHIDAAGNSYVCGNYYGDYNREDVVVFKLNTLGQRLWTYEWRGLTIESSEIALNLAVDVSGNTYVIGTFDSTQSQNDKNIFILKLDNAGQLLWRNYYAGTAGGNDTPVGIKLGANGNVYIAANSVNTGTGADGLALCYDPNGNLLWSSVYSGNSLSEIFMAMEIDSQDNLYATGLMNPTNGFLSDGLVVKFNALGTVLWDSLYNNTAVSNSRDFFNCIAIDGNDNAFVGGFSNNNWVTAKYLPTGQRIWTQNYSYSNNLDSVCAIAIDKNNNVIVGGIFGQFSEQDVGIIKYRNDSTQVWVKRFANSAGSNDMLMHIIVDDTNNIYTTGWETENFTTNFQMQVLKYDSTGTFKYEIIWTDSLGNSPDYGKKIGFDGLGNLYLMGDANDNCYGNTFFNGFRYDIQVLKYGYGSTVGIGETIHSKDKALLLYPNPAKQFVNVRFNKQLFENDLIELRLYNVNGQLMLENRSMRWEEFELNVSEMPAGVYMFTVTQGSTRHTEKMIIQ
jgi:hypothetical protein